jgi:hypothetical protein
MKRIWILLTAACTFLAGFCAAVGQWPLFWWILGVWVCLGLALALYKRAGA